MFRFLGSSGQNIKDIRAYSKLSDALDIMEKTLDWGHLCPTAPDTLNCYPYLDEDPFVLNEYPHIYFAGNMPKMDFRQYGEKPVLMVSVPKFQETYTATLINLRTLEVEPITFGYNPN
ncbi:DNA polymerase delta subunit 2-like [Stegodyphus dumicola]|uniref:DNA polymerase delta subunit 2-like n=1 Tax=Stegodyphus dumicola TaxID=202533 RepID=UPI0015AC8C6E|nr:DNA polymerase delta subunit 2-like [Stegodyphus dumicola]